MFVPSTVLSSAALIVKFADAWPSGMVTVEGTVASPLSSLESETTSEPDVPPTRVTVPVVEGEVLLGQWQRVMFVELDQARERRAFIHAQGG